MNLSGIGLESLASGQLSQIWLSTMLHFLWQATLVGCGVLVLERLMRSSSPRTRYIMYFAALISLPLSYIATFSYSLRRAPLASVEVAAPVVDQRPTPVASRDAISVVVKAEQPSNASPTLKTAPTDPADSATTTDELSAVPAATMEETTSLATRLLMAYILVSLGLMLRLVVALWGGHRLRRGAMKLASSQLRDVITAQAKSMGLWIVPVVAHCERIAVPTVVGIFKPAILIPASLATGLTTAELSAVIGHEMAHIRRLDPLINLLQRLVECLFFFHPAVWLISQRLSSEREACCDDLVLSSGMGMTDYVQSLLKMAELCTPGAKPSIATLAGTGETTKDFEYRMLRLIDAKRRPVFRLTRSGLATLAALPLLLALTPALLAGMLQGDPLQPIDKSRLVNLESGEPYPDFNPDLLEVALAHAKRTQDPAARSSALYLLVGPIAKLGRLDEARELAEQVRDPWQRINGWNSVAVQAHRQNEPDLVELALSNARKAAVENNLITHPDMVRTHVKTDRRALIEQFAKEHSIHAERIYEEIANQLAALGRLDEAYEIIRTRVGANRWNYAHIEMGKAAAFARRFKDANEILGNLESENAQVQLRGYLIHFLIRDGRRAAIARVVGAEAEPPNHHQPSNSEPTLEQQIEQAKTRSSLLPLLKEKFEREVTKGNIAAADGVIEDMLSAFKKWPSAGMMIWLHGAGMKNDETESAELVATCQVRIIEELVRRGATNTARERVAKLQAAVEQVKRVGNADRASGIVVTYLATGLALVGEIESAHKQLDSLNRSGFASSWHSQGVVDLVRRLLSVNQPQRAVEFATKYGVSGGARSIMPLLHEGNVDQAMQWLDVLKPGPIDYRLLGKEMVRAGHLPELLRVLPQLPSEAARAHVLIGAGYEEVPQGTARISSSVSSPTPPTIGADSKPPPKTQDEPQERATQANPPIATKSGNSDTSTSATDRKLEKSLQPEDLLAQLKRRDQMFDNRTLEVEKHWTEYISPRSQLNQMIFNDIKFGMRQETYPKPEDLPDDYEQPHRKVYRVTSRFPDVTLETVRELEKRILPDYGSLENAGMRWSTVGGVERSYSPATKSMHVRGTPSMGGLLRMYEHAYQWSCGYGFSRLLDSIESIERRDELLVVKAKGTVFEIADTTFDLELDQNFIVRRAVISVPSSTGGSNEYSVETEGTVQLPDELAVAQQGKFKRVVKPAGRKEHVSEDFSVVFAKLTGKLSDSDYRAATEINLHPDARTIDMRPRSERN